MIVAITGTMGAGKSSLSSYLKTQGYDVIDTDKMVHDYYEKKGQLYPFIINTFGKEVLDETQNIDRKKLSKKVFNDATLLKLLENKAHTLVKQDVLKLRNDYQDSLLFVEVPLLFEANMQDYFDKIITIDAYKKHRYERLINKGFEISDIQRREKRQYTGLFKKKHSDFVINNNSSIDSLHKNIEKILEDLL